MIERALALHPGDAAVTAPCWELLAWLREGRPPTLTASKAWLAMNMTRLTFYRRLRRRRPRSSGRFPSYYANSRLGDLAIRPMKSW